MIHIKRFVGLLLFTTLSLFATNTTTTSIQESIKQDLMIGYYGRPFAKSLGILGHSSIDELVKQVKTKCTEFTQISESINVTPAFHIIYGLATKEPGGDGDYIKNLNHDILMQYIEAAQKENFAVIIDLQLGVLNPLEAIKPVLKYLKYDNVHLALDPEFKIPSHKRYPPGRYIGHIFGKDINEVQAAMNDYIKINNIQGKRMLLVHMFHKRMVRKKEVIKNFDNINLVYNIDGHGSAGNKVKIYNNLYKQEYTKVASSGYKIFYNNDVKPLTTPRQMLGLDNVGSRRIHTPPVYINYH